MRQTETKQRGNGHLQFRVRSLMLIVPFFALLYLVCMQSMRIAELEQVVTIHAKELQMLKVKPQNHFAVYRPVELLQIKQRLQSTHLHESSSEGIERGMTIDAIETQNRLYRQHGSSINRLQKAWD